MTLAAQPALIERADVRTIVGGGAVLGILTAVGVTVFSLVSRGIAAGTMETVVQMLLVLGGGVMFAYFPSAQVQPRRVDSIAWTALLGLLGALFFTVVDTALLRPMNLYHWRWDAVGGGSGWWYIPVWWMGSATLAWLGAWITSNQAARGEVAFVVSALQTAVIALLLFAILVLTRVGPFTAAFMAFAFVLGLVVQVMASAAMARR